MNKLRNLRKEKDVLQSEVANYLGVSTTTYSNYENETRDISTEMLIKNACNMLCNACYKLFLWLAKMK